MARLGSILAALIFTTIACGPLHQLSASSPPTGTIPWLPLPADLTPVAAPSPEPVPVPAGTPACSGAELIALNMGSQGATGHVVSSVEFAATRPGGCYLDGTPSVALLDAAGHVLPFKERAPVFPPSVIGPAYVAQGPAPEPHTALKYGQASLTVDWVSQPETCPGQSGVSIAGMRIDMPAGALTVPLVDPAPEGYACQGLGVGSFESPPLPVAEPPQPPLPAIALGIQSGAYPGKNFEYLVTLTNDTKTPLNLAATCPNYEEEFFADIADGSPPLGGKHFYRLNCAPAGTLAPGTHRIFEMIFAVPADATPDTYTLMFGLGFSNGITQTTQRPVVVLKAA